MVDVKDCDLYTDKKMNKLCHHDLPVPAGSMGVDGARVCFVVPRSAVTIHESTVLERCLEITTAVRNQIRQCAPEKYL